MIVETVKDQLSAVREASRALLRLSPEETRSIIHKVADHAAAQAEKILQANQMDLDKMAPDNPMFDRLLLNESRLQSIFGDMATIADMPSPLDVILEEKTVPSGLLLKRISVPLGVVAVVYESRPNVTFDLFTIAFKTGNGLILKGGKEALATNTAIYEIIADVLAEFDLREAVQLYPTDRSLLPALLTANDFVDVLIPRGSKRLIDFVRQNASVPVIETGAGIVHTYFDASGDLNIGKEVIANAKTRRVSVCNALDTLLIHQDRLKHLPILMQGLDKAHQLQVYADQAAHEVLAEVYDEELLSPAESDHFGTEFLSMKMAIKTVPSFDAALEHIHQHGSKHSEAIIATDVAKINRFYREVDAAAVYSNTSTAFTDGGEFGLGAEIGISTQKLHARGPMGLEALTSSKWIVEGSGQIRE